MLRRILPVLLAFVVAVSAVGAGVAQGRLPPANALVLCAGHGVVTVYVDQNGTRVEQTVLCPDCALNAPLPLPVLMGPAQGWLAMPLDWPMGSTVGRSVDAGLFAWPRGPPSRV